MYLSWPRRRAVARLARRIREDSIWIRQACITQPGVQQATAHAGYDQMWERLVGGALAPNRVRDIRG